MGNRLERGGGLRQAIILVQTMHKIKSYQVPLKQDWRIKTGENKKLEENESLPAA